MTTVVKLDQEDVKKIIAEHFHIDPSQVIKSQYSYFVQGIAVDGLKEEGDE